MSERETIATGCQGMNIHQYATHLRAHGIAAFIEEDAQRVRIEWNPAQGDIREALARAGLTILDHDA